MSRNQEFSSGQSDHEPIKAYYRYYNGEQDIMDYPSEHHFDVTHGHNLVSGVMKGATSSSWNYYTDSRPEDGPNSQMALFDTEYNPPHVDDLFATKNGRHLVPTVLGLMAQHSLRHYGGLPEADTRDLSAHSARLVKRLQSAGVISGEEPEVTNDHSFIPMGHAAHRDLFVKEHHDKEFSPSEIRDSQKLVRELLRPKRSKNLQPKQFPDASQQGTLFD